MNKKDDTKTKVRIEFKLCELYCPKLDNNGGFIDGNYLLYSCPELSTPLRWTKPTSWPYPPYNSDRVPEADEYAWIPPNCVYIMDHENTPIYNQVTVDGKVVWEWNMDPTLPRVLNTKVLHNRGGEIYIGGDINNRDIYLGELA